MSKLSLSDCSVEVEGKNGSFTFDAIEVEMFLQQLIAELGNNDAVVHQFQVVPKFVEWAKQKEYDVTYSEAWAVMQECRRVFEEAKKKFGS